MFISKKLLEKKIREAEARIYRETNEERFREEMYTKIDILQHKVEELQYQVDKLRNNNCCCENNIEKL